MRLQIHSQLDYRFARSTDILLQVEAAQIPEQVVEYSEIALPSCEHIARVPAQDGIGERIWLRLDGPLQVDYRATVSVQRIIADWPLLDRVSPHLLPGETVPYLLPSCYCPTQRFESFVESEFGAEANGATIVAMRDWIGRQLHYTPGCSDHTTTAADTFISRQGICRDYAHLLITFARAAGIPARIASVYARGVDPPDFHAVAEVFLGGEWHLVDATGMAHEAEMAKIGIGRDAADVAFLTSFGPMTMMSQSVLVEEADSLNGPDQNTFGQDAAGS